MADFHPTVPAYSYLTIMSIPSKEKGLLLLLHEPYHFREGAKERRSEQSHCSIWVFCVNTLKSCIYNDGTALFSLAIARSRRRNGLAILDSDAIRLAGHAVMDRHALLNVHGLENTFYRLNESIL